MTRAKPLRPTKIRRVKSPSPPAPIEVPAQVPTEQRDDRDSRLLFPIVGIGASAGGLEAFTLLLKSLPADTGMAFVLVQHLAPSHPSALAEILSRATTMPVTEVNDERTVEPNHVYVIPPARSMVIAGGVLQLLPREGGGIHRPIDRFFRALADDRSHQAIGVVLSGTANDGTLGLEGIKAAGGITFAQDASAQHAGMPQSAIASGCVDFVLPPDEIAREITRVGRNTNRISDRGEADGRAVLDEVVGLLQHATGVDFRNYKFNTFHRRVTRRMVLQNLERFDDYVNLLRKTPAEVDALYHDILISVTSFFRNPEVFDALKMNVFPSLVKNRSRGDPVRIWTVGCSSGEEAYSLAIAYSEYADESGTRVPLQLFATDLNAAGIEKARAGLYRKDIAEDVSPGRLRQFFVEVDGHYRIAKSIRDACVFSRHNVLTDPPFSRIDLISCRNLLIYLEPVLQQKVIPTLHYALKPAGFLVLGTSETPGAHRNLFEGADTRHRIYARKLVASPGRGGFPMHRGDAPRVPFAPVTAQSVAGADLPREADRILSTRFAPPGVVVSAGLDILQYRGDTGPYLAPVPGTASLNLLKMLREGLPTAVRAAVLRASREGVAVKEEGLRVRSHDGYRTVAVEVVPLRTGREKEGGFLVLFKEPAPAGAVASPDAPAPDTDSARLAQELAATREYLQSVIEQQEAANEELQAASEEVQSANEELQSSNEELETSKEEIQSSNEELATVNDELNNRNAELNRVNNDLVNLIGSIQTAIVILGPDLRIRRFTPVAEKLLSLIPSDVGRSLADIKLNLQDLHDLEPLLDEVLYTASIAEREVRDKHGRWYALRLRPYRTLDNRIDGVVMMLVDIDLLKRAHAYTESIVATLREPILVLDKDLRVRTASRAFYEAFQVTRETTDGRLLPELGNGQFNVPELLEVLGQVVSRGLEVVEFEIRHEFEHMGLRVMQLTARRLIQAGDEAPLILLAIEDVTERIRLTNELRIYAADLSEVDRRKSEFLAMLAHELRNPLAPIRNAIEIMRLRNIDGGAVEATEMMSRQLSQMVRLVDDLLDVSRISLGKLELRRERVELATVIRQAVETALPVVRLGGHDLTVTLPPGPVILHADAVRLAQAFGNLLNNAAKYSDSGSRISLLVDVQGLDVVISVKDTGIGIAAEMLPKIFELFTQVDHSLERSQGGLGIGLTLVQRLVELHGGSVEATSEGPGQGSEFIVRLPILVEDAEPVLAEPAGEAATPTQRRILVVDDNRDSAKSLAMLLQLTGHQTQTAFDGIEAVEAAASFRPDVVLLDIGLPKLNGYEVARRIRMEPWGKTMVLVALTGWGQAEDRQRSSEVGFDAHLIKPVDHAALLKLMDELSAVRGS